MEKTSRVGSPNDVAGGTKKSDPDKNNKKGADALAKRSRSKKHKKNKMKTMRNEELHDVERQKSLLQKVGLAISRFLNPQPEVITGRIIQMLGMIFFALLAVAGIVVQVYTDAELSKIRQAFSSQLNYRNTLTSELYDVALLLTDEMEPMYEFNTGPYDTFLEKAQSIMKSVDTKLIWNDVWITDFSDIPAKERENISSSTTLRLALHAQRDVRKSSNDTSEAQIIAFYSTIIDNLAVAAQSITLNATRFPGWQEYLGVVHIFQALLNLRKFALVGLKLATENRTITSVNDPVYLSCVDYYMQYNRFVEIASLDAPFIDDQMKNLTSLDSAKLLDTFHALVLKQNFLDIDANSWNEASDKQIAAVKWILTTVRRRANQAMAFYSGSWESVDMFSVVFLAVSGFFAVATVPVHLMGTWRLQRQIQKYYENLNLLNEALNLLYDCIPRSFVKSVKLLGDSSPANYFPDTCVMVLDAVNLQAMANQLDADDLIATITRYYETIENCLAKFKCFKIDVNGDTFALCCGVGEYHSMDHVAEMVFLALELRHNMILENEKSQDGKIIWLRFGIHVGPCYSRMVNVQIPRMALAGDVGQIASAVHAFSLPMKILVTRDVFERLEYASELSFIRRGIIDFNESDEKGKVETFWTIWAEDDEFDDGDTISVGSSVSRLLSQTLSNQETNKHMLEALQKAHATSLGKDEAPDHHHHHHSHQTDSVLHSGAEDVEDGNQGHHHKHHHHSGHDSSHNEDEKYSQIHQAIHHHPSVNQKPDHVHFQISNLLLHDQKVDKDPKQEIEPVVPVAVHQSETLPQIKIEDLLEEVTTEMQIPSLLENPAEQGKISETHSSHSHHHHHQHHHHVAHSYQSNLSIGHSHPSQLNLAQIGLVPPQTPANEVIGHHPHSSDNLEHLATRSENSNVTQHLKELGQVYGYGNNGTPVDQMPRAHHHFHRKHQLSTDTAHHVEGKKFLLTSWPM